MRGDGIVRSIVCWVHYSVWRSIVGTTILACIPSHWLKRSWHSCLRWVNASNKYTQHALSTKTECDYLYGWIIDGHMQKSHHKGWIMDPRDISGNTEEEEGGDETRELWNSLMGMGSRETHTTAPKLKPRPWLELAIQQWWQALCVDSKHLLLCLSCLACGVSVMSLHSWTDALCVSLLLTTPFLVCCVTDIYTGRTCRDTTFGCCSDGRTAALGPNRAGCPGKHLPCVVMQENVEPSQALKEQMYCQ